MALKEGRLRAEGVLSPKGHLKEGQCCRHFLHRHEPPVPAGSIEVVGVTDDIVAVNKPAGMPVHVAGQYRKNTVQGVLEAGTNILVLKNFGPVTRCKLFCMLFSGEQRSCAV